MFNIPIDYSKAIKLNLSVVAIYTFPKDMKGIIASNNSGSDQYMTLYCYKPSSKSNSIQSQLVENVIVKNGSFLYLPVKLYQYVGPFAVSGFEVYELY